MYIFILLFVSIVAYVLTCVVIATRVQFVVKLQDKQHVSDILNLYRIACGIVLAASALSVAFDMTDEGYLEYGLAIIIFMSFGCTRSALTPQAE